MYVSYPNRAGLPTSADPLGLARWAKQANQIFTSTSHPESVTPPRPGAAASQTAASNRVSRLLVVCESKRGRAEAAADAVSSSVAARGVVATVGTIDEISPSQVAAADALIVGCWVPGRTPFGDDPMRRMAGWVDTLDAIDGKPVGIFCTYRFFPHTFADVATRTAETENGLARCFERKGAEIAAIRSIHFKSIDEGAGQLVESVLDYV